MLIEKLRNTLLKQAYFFLRWHSEEHGKVTLGRKRAALLGYVGTLLFLIGMIFWVSQQYSSPITTSSDTQIKKIQLLGNGKIKTNLSSRMSKGTLYPVFSINAVMRQKTRDLVVLLVRKRPLTGSPHPATGFRCQEKWLHTAWVFGARWALPTPKLLQWYQL